MDETIITKEQRAGIKEQRKKRLKVYINFALYSLLFGKGDLP